MRISREGVFIRSSSSLDDDADFFLGGEDLILPPPGVWGEAGVQHPPS